MNSASSAPETLDSQGLESLNASVPVEQGTIETLDCDLHLNDLHLRDLHLEAHLHPEDHHPEDLSEEHSHSEANPEVHSHIHDEASLRRLVNRLSRIEGHIRGIKTMVQEHRPCPEVLTQVAAVRGALDKVARTILDDHLTECVVRAAKEGDSAKIDYEIAQLRSALKQFF